MDPGNDQHKNASKPLTGEGEGGWTSKLTGFTTTTGNGSSASATKPSTDSWASAAGKLTGKMKTAVANFDKMVEDSLFEASPASPPKVPPHKAESGSSMVSSSSSLALPPSSRPPIPPPRQPGPPIITTKDASATASAALASASQLVNVGLANLKKLAQGEEDEVLEEEEEDAAAVGGSAGVVIAKGESLSIQIPTISQKDKEKASQALLQSLELMSGGMLALVHTGRGLPLIALETELQSLVKISWLRLILHKSYWTEALGPTNLATINHYVSYEEAIPAMDGKALYRTTADDAVTIVVAQLTSISGGKTRLFAGPIDIDPQVKTDLESALSKGFTSSPCWAGEGKLRIKSSNSPSPTDKDAFFRRSSNIGLEASAHDIGLELSSFGLKLECLNADTSRGFSVTLGPEVQIRTSPATPTHVGIEVPIGHLISYYGDRSGELGHYINLVIPPNKTEDETNSGKAIFTIVLATVVSRDLLSGLLRSRISALSGLSNELVPWQEQELGKTAHRVAEEAKTESVRLKLQEDLKVMHTNFQNMTLERNQLSATILREKSATELVQKQLLEVQERLQQAEQQVVETRKSLTAKETEIASFLAQINTVQEESKKAKEEAEKIREEREAHLKRQADENIHHLQEEITTIRAESAQAKKKAESLTRELKQSLGGPGSTGSTAENALRSKVERLEALLEAAGEERKAYKEALERALSQSPPSAPALAKRSSVGGKP